MMSELITLLFLFAKIGFFTVGGGMAMLPLVQQELLSRGLMTIRQSIDMVAISQMTPGPFAVNCATFTGMRLYGISGAFFATLGVALPSFIICLIVAHFFFSFNHNAIVRSVLGGIKPIVLSLILSGLISIGKAAIFPEASFASLDFPVLCIAIIISVLFIKTKVSPIFLVLLSGIFGAIFLRG